MRFTVRQKRSASGKPFAAVEYEILDGPEVVARYWHDHKGDEHGIVFLDGSREDWPVGRMTEFLTGGGPTPLGLSHAAVRYLADTLIATMKTKFRADDARGTTQDPV